MKIEETKTINRRMSILLAAIVVLMIFILDELERDIPALDFLFILVVLATVYVAGANRRWVIVGIVLAVPTVILALLSNTDEWPMDNLAIAFLVILTIFILYACLAILHELLHVDLVTVHTISGAMAVFLLVGLLWAILYFLAEATRPNSFTIAFGTDVAGDISLDMFASLTYFSLITLTSVGYGDITPATDTTRALATLEAVLGQIFLAVLIAWLVGKFLVHSMEQK